MNFCNGGVRGRAPGPGRVQVSLRSYFVHNRGGLLAVEPQVCAVTSGKAAQAKLQGSDHMIGTWASVLLHRGRVIERRGDVRAGPGSRMARGTGQEHTLSMAYS